MVERDELGLRFGSISAWRCGASRIYISFTLRSFRVASHTVRGSNPRTHSSDTVIVILLLASVVLFCRAGGFEGRRLAPRWAEPDLIWNGMWPRAPPRSPPRAPSHAPLRTAEERRMFSGCARERVAYLVICCTRFDSLIASHLLYESVAGSNGGAVRGGWTSRTAACAARPCVSVTPPTII